jgi:hypothetical protein
MYSKTPLYCPSIHRQTRVSPRISAVPFSVCSNNPVKMPNSHTAIRFRRKSNQFRVVKKTINCFHSNIYFPWLLVYLPWLTGILKSPRCDIIDWHYDWGLITVNWPFDLLSGKPSFVLWRVTQFFYLLCSQFRQKASGLYHSRVMPL